MSRFQCPACYAFVSLASAVQKINNNVYCKNCGKSFFIDSALLAGTRRADTRPFDAQGVAFQNVPKGNAPPLFNSKLLPNGKLAKIKIPTSNESLQLDLFGGAI